MFRYLLGIALVGLIVAFVYLQLTAKAPVTQTESIATTVKELRASGKIDDKQQSVVMVQLAIQGYIVKKGRPPEELDQLVPDFLSNVPNNPETGKPFDYLVVRLESGGTSYKLGAQVSQYLAKGEQGDTGGKETSDPNAIMLASLLGEDGFINPNDMESDPFVYDASGRRDPFLPFNLAPETEFNPNVSPLLQYGLGQLRLTAVLETGLGKKIALVENSAGRGFSVEEGMKIGNRGGTVAEIANDKMVIVEQRVDFTGKERQEVVEMKLTPKVATSSKEKGRKK